MASITSVMVTRNDDYGGDLKERAAYAINSALLTYDEVIVVDWNSRDKTLVEEINGNIYNIGKLRNIIVRPKDHEYYTRGFQSPQPCSEVLGRNVGIRRATSDFIVSTNIDEVQPTRRFIEGFTDKDKLYVLARRGCSLGIVRQFGNPLNISQIVELLKELDLPQSWAVTREPYSLVEWCGDFQMAHRDAWNRVRGYSEWQLGVGIHDSYLHRKFMESGMSVEVVYNAELWHLDHHKSSLYNEKSVPNSNECIMNPDFFHEDNDENWGIVDHKFEEFRV